MQISAEVHNYMETLVGQLLSESNIVAQFNSEQLADIACLALVQLKPVYIRHDIDFLATLPEDKLTQLKHNASVAVENAVKMIEQDRRQNRNNDVPILLSYSNESRQNALELYDDPI
ncbi:competence protein ComFB [Vibrio azureus]|uniref:Late competence development protein ComFB n=1 Tax=Vibrio azureus NBRC 104587 TaxID=1219077 RepID=U3C964_9VIBR|nr:late competence development ComFB family protein [Vibrio azureus]AUI88224.1 competence protein ComFB [Vibrio azureus]GAD77899.1 hypothetical protein VAZ01S_098_00080 [Vibrio azureus NBRC 104587]